MACVDTCFIHRLMWLHRLMYIHRWFQFWVHKLMPKKRLGSFFVFRSRMFNERVSAVLHLISQELVCTMAGLSNWKCVTPCPALSRWMIHTSSAWCVWEKHSSSAFDGDNCEYFDRFTCCKPWSRLPLFFRQEGQAYAPLWLGSRYCWCSAVTPVMGIAGWDGIDSKWSCSLNWMTASSHQHEFSLLAVILRSFQISTLRCRDRGRIHTLLMVIHKHHQHTLW